jgi:hypothetical protein
MLCWSCRRLRVTVVLLCTCIVLWEYCWRSWVTVILVLCVFSGVVDFVLGWYGSTEKSLCSSRDTLVALGVNAVAKPNYGSEVCGISCMNRGTICRGG